MQAPDLLARRNAALGAATPLFYDEPVNIVRGEGVWLFDAQGRRYLDMYNNVPCVGHSHPRVVEAMHTQAATLNVHSRYLHEGVVEYAERLIGLHAEPIERVVITCTGTEASEVALMMARAATGARGIICTNAAYHGNSTEVSKLSRISQQGGSANPEIRSIPFPERYRPIRDGVSEAELTSLYLAEVETAIQGFAASGVPFAGMFLCSILANEGLPDIPAGFMAGAAALVRDAGGVFIADEVQAGFCRTGRWWGYQVTGFEPDIVTMGKPMGAGLPIAGVAARAAIADAFRAERRYFNTFAASPLQAAVGSAVIDVLVDEDLAANAEAVGLHLRAGLREMQSHCQPIADVRGHGLFCGIEWVVDRESRTPDREGAIDIVNRLKRRGFLISNAGALGNVLKIRPPLVFGREHADSFLEAFSETIDELGHAG